MRNKPHDAKYLEDVQNLKLEHRIIDEKISVLEERLYLSPSEQMDCKRLKKLRLVLRDRLLALGEA